MDNLGKESEDIEFKESVGQLEKGILGLSAMLNRCHHGMLYIGVGDNGDVIGMDVGDSTLEKISNAIRTDIVPRIIPEMSVHTSSDGKKYLEIRVIGHSVPYSYKEKYYIRNVTSNESADPDVLSQIVLTRGLDPLKGTVSDIQELTFDQLFASLAAHGGHPRNEGRFFKSLDMLDDRGDFNLTAYLLSDQNSMPMQIVEFDGTDRTRITAREDFRDRSLLKSMEAISDRVMGYQETRVDTSTLERTEKPLFDADAFREVWVNACVHNAWRQYIPPSVLIFDDRMEIISYGRIPFPMSDEDFYLGDSRPINPGLFRIFARLRKIEQTGHGVPTIVRKYGREAFHITESGVKVTIPFAFTPRFVKLRKYTEKDRTELDSDRRAVLEVLENNPGAKLSDVSEETGMNLSAVKRAVVSLKKEGYLRNDGNNRKSVWVVL